MNDLEATRKVKDAAMDELRKARERIEALEREVAELRAANKRAVSAMRDMEKVLERIYLFAQDIGNPPLESAAEQMRQMARAALRASRNGA